jgi:anti-sigma B factor antagonist
MADPTAAAVQQEAPAEFAIDASEIDRVCVIEVVGELDLSSAPALCARLEQVLRQRAPRVLIDLSRLQFCDSTGLRALFGAVQEAQIRRARLRIVSPSEPAAARVFELSGGAEFLPLTSCAAVGLAELAPRPGT